MKTILIIIILGSLSMSSSSQGLPRLEISDNQHFIVTDDNKPFFWLGDTAWELIHRLTLPEIDLYLTDRANKGFTVIQTVVLAELDGLNTPNAYGNKPLIDNDPTRLNNDYFELVDYVVKKSQQLGMYVALLPTWGDKFNLRWGVGPEIFTPENSEIFGALLAKRYQDNEHIIWVLGGDRIPEDPIHFEIIRSMAKGIKQAETGQLVTYHPMGGQMASRFFNDSWMDIDMYQSGHNRNTKEYKYVWESRNNMPPKPVINGEPRYENIPDKLDMKQTWVWLDDTDVRVAAYWSIMAGAAGTTYGCNDIWQMYSIGRQPVLQARTGWQTALNLPGAGQMTHMKAIFEQIPWQSMVNDQTLIMHENQEDASFTMASIGENKDFMVAYTPTGKSITLDLSKLNPDRIKGYWFNPRNGKIHLIDVFETSEPTKFNPWAKGWGSDFLLLLTNQELKTE
jgi:hypothetical protein